MPPLEPQEEDTLLVEDEGGPVKSFLEHLEDLRWVLIKSIATVGIAMLICLIGGNYVVGILKRPLEKAQAQYPGHEQIVVVMLGTNRLGVYHLDDVQKNSFHFSTNRYVVVQVQPKLVGTNASTTNGFGTNFTLDLTVDNSVDAEAIAKHLDVQLNTLSPADGFFVAFQVAMYAGVAISSPFLFYFICQFVFPALKWKEKRYVYRGLLFFVPLFVIGASFCYFILLPVALSASQMYSQWLGFAANIWKADEYIGFVSKFILGMGLGFEMPVVILVLVKIGILNYTLLSKGRRYMILINLVLGALLTTPEVLTQVLMAVPLQLLYEISVWIAWYWERKEKKRAAAEAAGFSDER
jgi:sec-independent protein translocase protein TatC